MNPESLTDEQLLARFRSGDERAFAVLHERHRDALVRYASRIVRSPDDGEDVVQESLARAYAALRDDPRDIRVLPWLYTTVHHRAIDHLRRRRASPPLDDAPATASAQDEALRRAELRDAVADVRALPDRQRQAVAMVALEGRSHAEVAARLGTTVGSSKSLLKRARTSLAAMADARSLPCPEARAAIDRSAAHGTRLPAAIHRHLSGCGACRAHHGRARGRRRLLLAPLALLARLLPAGAPAVGLTVLAVGAPAVLSGGGHVVSQRTLGGGDPAPRTIARHPQGRPLPKDIALVEAVVRLPAGREHPPPGRLTLACPDGFVVHGLSAGGGKPGAAVLRRVGLLSSVRSGHDTKGVVAFQARPNLAQPVALRLGIVCRTPASWRRIDAAGRKAECEALRDAPSDAHVERALARCPR